MFEEKIIPVCGDIMLPDLGISEHDRHRLEQEVHLVFHSAATVRFEETLRFEEKIPFGGTWCGAKGVSVWCNTYCIIRSFRWIESYHAVYV